MQNWIFRFRSVEKDKMQGLQNIKCIPLGRTSRFHPFVMVAEICWEARFRRSLNNIFFCKGWTFFSFYITIKRMFFRKCFEYVHTIQGIESILKVVCIVNHWNKVITSLHSCIIFVILSDIRLEAYSFIKNEFLNTYFSSILGAISPGNCKSCYF